MRLEISYQKERDTLQLKSDTHQKIQNKTVIVMDDFSTSGMSLEVAKNLLMENGADKVILCAIGKYGDHHGVYDRDGKLLKKVSLDRDQESEKRLVDIINQFNEIF